MGHTRMHTHTTGWYGYFPYEPQLASNEVDFLHVINLCILSEEAITIKVSNTGYAELITRCS